MRTKKTKLTDEQFTAFMSKLHDDVGGSYYEDGETYFDIEDDTSVFANVMSAREYAAMERDLGNFESKGKGWSIGAWNDSSSYEYWREQGESGDANYIRITVHIDRDKTHLIDQAKLISAIHEAKSHFGSYDNSQAHWSDRQNREMAAEREAKVKKAAVKAKDREIIVIR